MTRKPQAPSRPSFFRPARLLLGLAILLALLAAGHAVLWRVMANRLEEGFRLWAETRRAQGWQVAHGTPVAGGWPFSASLTLPEPRIAGPAAGLPQGLAWQAASATLRVVLPDLTTLRVEADGPQRLRLGAVEWPFVADRLTAELPLDPDAPPDSAEIRGQQIRIGAAGGLLLERLEAGLASSSSATAAEPALTLSASLAGLILPLDTPLGRRIDTATLDAALTGPLPMTRQPAARAAQWRDAGGTLEVRAMTLRWGEAAGSAAATLALDENLQPMGAGTLRLFNPALVLEALIQAGTVDARSAGLARGVLPMLARPDANGGPPQLEVPVTLEDRTLSGARIPLLRLPPLRWEGRPAG